MRQPNLKRLLMIFITIMVVVVIGIIYSTQKEYTGEYVKFGELLSDSNTTTRLEESSIPFKIEDNIIYIPEDAFDKAIYCCT